MNILDLAILKKLGGGGGGTGSADIDVTAEVGQTIIVKEVDENGKPTKWESADYQPRTHWTEEGIGDIVPLITYIPVYVENFGCTVYPVNPFKLIEGRTYTVIFDGVEYSCEAKTFDMGDGMSGIAIGNTVFSGGANTGEPFAVGEVNSEARSSLYGSIAHEKHYMVLGMDTAQHTLRVIGEKNVYNKIPTEYAKSDFVVEFALNLDKSMVMVTPWEEILNAVKTNTHIYGALYKEGYDVNQYGEFNFLYHQCQRWHCLYAKIGRDGHEQKCTMKFLGTDVNGELSLITCTRDEKGITTVKAGYA